jgi:hypothetical protein
MGKIHRYAGPFILVIGAVNGVLGFNFSGGGVHNIFYGPVVVVVFVLLAGTLFWARRKKGSKAKLVRGAGAYEGYSREEGGEEGESLRGMPLGQYPSEHPPDYGRVEQPRALV